MTLEQVEANQTSMRNDIDSMQEKMNRLLKAMLSMDRKESNLEINIDAWNIVAHIGSSSLNIQGVTNPKFGFIHPEGAPVPTPVVVPVVNFGAQNQFIASARQGSMYDDEDPFDMPQEIRHAARNLSDSDMERLRKLEEKFKSIDVHCTIGMDVVDMFLVPVLVIPKKFKVPNFDRYKWVSYPHTHLGAYCLKTEAQINNDKLMIHYF